VCRVLPRRDVLTKQEGFAAGIPVGSACSTSLRQQYIDLTTGLGLKTLVTFSVLLVQITYEFGELLHAPHGFLTSFLDGDSTRASLRTPPLHPAPHKGTEVTMLSDSDFLQCDLYDWPTHGIS
jgi:hypothetical protein